MSAVAPKPSAVSTRHGAARSSVLAEAEVARLLRSLRSSADDRGRRTGALIERHLDALVAEAPAGWRERVRRRVEIVRRYDVEREPAKSLAGEFGLSRRHFYRERRAALLALGDKIRASRDASHACSSIVENVLDVAVTAAHVLSRAGRAAEAGALYERYAATARDPNGRIALLCHAANVKIGFYDFTGARRLLAEARRIVADARSSERRDEAEARSSIALIEANVPQDVYDPRASYASSRPAMIEGLRGPGTLSDLGVRLQIASRIRHAHALAGEGSFEAARRLVDEIVPFLDVLPNDAGHANAGYLFLKTAVEVESSGPAAAQFEAARAAMVEAGRQGSLQMAAMSAATLTTICAATNDPRASQFAEASLDLADLSNSPSLLASVCVRASEAFNAIGDPTRAASLARRVLRNDHPYEMTRLRARLSRCDAWSRMGRTDAAALEAAACLDEAEIHEDRIGRAIAQIVLARCAGAAGDAESSRRRLRKAVSTGGWGRAILPLHLALGEAERLGL